jgi:RNA polymerase sigma-70 factor, ECF subfamily
MNACLDRDASTFEAHRRALIGLAYRMLGSRSEAEDVVQDAYLRWHAADRSTVEEPRRYLGTVVTRLCLDRMKAAHARRELYVGQWLPEPVVDEVFEDDVAIELAHDVSVALMLLLERLTLLERASFLLHDVFGLDFAEVARALGRGEAACRQLATRARAHIEAGRPRFPASREAGHRLAAAFQAAVSSGDIRALEQVLTEDAVLYSDGGGKRAAALNPIRGIDRIMRFFAGIARKNPALATIAARPATINGLPGFVMRETDGSVDTMAIDSSSQLLPIIGRPTTAVRPVRRPRAQPLNIGGAAEQLVGSIRKFEGGHGGVGPIGSCRNEPTIVPDPSIQLPARGPKHRAVTIVDAKELGGTMMKKPTRQGRILVPISGQQLDHDRRAHFRIQASSCLRAPHCQRRTGKRSVNAGRVGVVKQSAGGAQTRI